MTGKRLYTSHQYSWPNSHSRNAHPLQANYSYNWEGQLTSVSYPGDTSYGYSYDAMGRPNKLTNNGVDWVKDVTYGPADELTQMKYYYASGFYYAETRSYNNLLQLTNITANSPYAYTGVNLTYNYSSSQNNGQITSQQDAISGVTVNYSYDPLGELTAASTAGPDWGLAFTYDGFGNRTTQSVTKGSGPTVSLSINPANNRINSTGYTYDSNGNLTAMPGSTFVYDIENRMVQVTSSGSEYYGYDAWNRRVWKTTTTDGAGNIFFYGAMGELMGTYSCRASCGDDPPVKVETNLHFAGKLIRWDNAAVVLDRLGGVVKRSNIFASPQINQTSNYYPFGEERTTTGQDRTKFATYYRDSKMGFDYAINRYYNSSWGRFTTPDPHGPSANPANPLSWNRYAYVVNDPVNKNDPSGLMFALESDGWEYGGGGAWWDLFYDSGSWNNNDRGVPPDPGEPSNPRSGIPQWNVFNNKMQNRAYAAVKGLGHGCKTAFAEKGISIDAIAENSLRTKYYDVHVWKDTPILSISGYVDPLGQVKTVGQYVGTETAAVILDQNNKITNGVILGEPFFSASPQRQDITLVHEALHTGLNLGDSALASKLGLGENLSRDAASASISEYVKYDCKPLN